MFLENKKSPSRKDNELDNRGSNFYLVLYWARALADQSQDKELQEKFIGIAQKLSDNEKKIVDELNAAQGQSMDIGGYYHTDDNKTAQAMRPSKTLNSIIDAI